MSKEESQIQNFYKSQNVFLTGGTGFLGKILIEKLLRSTDISTLYVLIREKKGKNALSRVEELFDDVVFDRLKIECPKFKHRVEAIPGDCSLSGFGLTITDTQKLISNVQIVFHVAATVRFDENLKVAYQINVNATQEILNLSRQMTQLKSIVYVSTAFSNCTKNVIEEKFYDCPVSYENMNAIIGKISKKEAEIITPRVIGEWPNTYTFTKALAESMIKDVGAGLPIAIFRPSIILSTYKEPFPGWIDNLYGPNGTTVGVISGVLRVIPCDSNSIADVIPVDTCAAALIATGWDITNKEKSRAENEIPIYNYVSNPQNPVTWEELSSISFIISRHYPVLRSLWTPIMILAKNPYIYSFLKFFLHIIPAILFDIGLVITMNRPKMLRMYGKIHKFSQILRYFSTNTWQFTNKNTVNLWQNMSSMDKEIFPMNISDVHWLNYMRTYIQGIRIYLMKDPEITLNEAKKRNNRLQIVNTFIKISLILLAFHLVTALWYALLNCF